MYIPGKNLSEDIEMMVTSQQQRALEESWFQKYPLIKTGKLPCENANVKLLLCTEDIRERYSLNYKCMNMLYTLDSVNENIAEVYRLWDVSHEQNIEFFAFNNRVFRKVNSLNSYIIHDLKKYIDDVICVLYLLNHGPQCENIRIDCIGKYLYPPQKQEKMNEFDEFRDFLELVNNIENVYKHSMSNTMHAISGREEPCIFAMDSNHNNNVFHPTLYGISIKNLVDQFNEFYRFSFELLASK